TCGTHHFVAIHGVLAKDWKRQHVLLAVSPAEVDQTDGAHIEMLDTVPEFYHRDGTMVLFIVAENCATNQAITTQLLRYTNNAAELKRHVRLKPLKGNATRWSSTLEMLRRYVKIRGATKMVPVVKALLPPKFSP
ncbi:Hypothetical protein PHPALM_13874, partial [Phytophthora palmivora]